MVFPGEIEVTDSDGFKVLTRRPSYYNEQVELKSYNIYVTPTAGGLPVVSLSKELITSFGDQIEIILLNQNKMQISCKTSKVANELIKKMLHRERMNFYIPQQKVEVKGRIYLPKDISEKEAFENMTVKNRINTTAPLPSIVEVYRVPFFEKDSSGTHRKTDSDFMLISFCGTHVPTHILYDNSFLIPVQAYFEPVLQCKSCWFFGHSKKACRGKAKCVTCGLTHTENECTEIQFCVNCKGHHCCNDKKCPEFVKRKDLAKAKALKTVPTVEVEPTPVPTSFNIFNNLSSFPSLPPKMLTSSSVVQKDRVIKGNKRARTEKSIVEEGGKEKSPEVILQEITNKIIKGILGLEKTFLNSVIDEVKSTSFSEDELEVRVTEKIKELLAPPALKDPEATMEVSDSASDGPSHRS